MTVGWGPARPGHQVDGDVGGIWAITDPVSRVGFWIFSKEEEQRRRGRLGIKQEERKDREGSTEDLHV